MLVERLIFGTARLAGGASARASRAMLEAVLAAGVRHIDTAPSYGLGTAEALVGEVLRAHDAEVCVTAKLGSPRPRFALAQTWLRAAKRAIIGSGRPGFGAASPARTALPPPFAVSGDALRRSHDISLRWLGRIDWLLLHEAVPERWAPELIADLDALAGRSGAQPGYSYGAVFDPAADARAPEGWIAQAAIDPAWLIAPPGPGRAAPLALHSIALAAAWLAGSDPAFAQGRERARRLLRASGDAEDMAIALALAAGRVPQARLLFASIDPHRLRATLAAIALIEREGLGPALVGCFA